MEFTISNNRIHYTKDGKELAFLAFSEVDKNVYSLNSTVVEPSLRGQGIADLLMKEMIAFLETNKGLCIPVCSYTVHWFEKNPEYKNYLK